MRRVAALLSVLALAGPTTALADSAGDQQYQDPFGGSNNSGQNSSGGSGNASSPTPTPVPTTPPTSGGSTPTPTPVPTTAPTAPTSPGTTTSTGSGLPRTGLDAWQVGLLGLGLLCAGSGLRLRLRAHGA
jgi:hypothetical protein